MSQKWDQETLYFNGDNYFKDLIAAIHSAQTLVFFESYIYEKGMFGDRVTEALIAAANRGVKVRVLVDGIGSPGFGRAYFNKLQKNGVGVRFFRVLPWMIGRYPGDSRRWYWRLSERLRHFNQGNHRKFCLVDDNILFVGSFNVSDVHSQAIHKEKVWKDIGARVEGSETRYVHRAFVRAYRHFHVPLWSLKIPKLVLLNDSLILKRSDKHTKLRRMQTALKRIYLQTPYFVPPGYLMRSLVRRAKSGVDVRIIVPKSSDVWVVQWMSIGIIHYLAKKGVQIYFFKPQFNHQKVFIIDDWMCLGSTNLNHRSFLHDLEMDVVITHPENKLRLDQSFARDLELSSKYDPSHWDSIPLLVRWVGVILLRLRYWA